MNEDTFQEDRSDHPFAGVDMARALQRFTASYKHPTKAKLHTVIIYARDADDAARRAPQQDSKGRPLYGIH